MDLVKIAICLSGHLRKFDQTAASLFKFLAVGHEYDIFIHTWDYMGYSCLYKTDNTQDITQKYLTRIEQLYHPKKIVIQNSLFLEELKLDSMQYAPHLINVPKPVWHMSSMFYKIYAANELRKLYQLETGTKYDWVIRCRPDLLFHGLTHLPTEFIPQNIYLPSHLCGHNWLCDQFAIGMPDDMDLYSSFFFDIPEYFKAQKEYRPEVFMSHCMNFKKLNPVMWGCHFSILR
jgi:hypothetical protein